MPHSKGGRGRTWSEDEDNAIREAAKLTRKHGLIGFDLGDIQAGRRAMDDPYRNELRQVAKAIGRTYAAVRKRASRIGARSIGDTRTPRRQRHEADRSADPERCPYTVDLDEAIQSAARKRYNVDPRGNG